MSNIIEEQITEILKKHCGQVFYSIRDKDTGRLVRKEAYEVVTRDPKELEKDLRTSMELVEKEKKKEILILKGDLGYAIGYILGTNNESGYLTDKYGKEGEKLINSLEKE